MMLRWKISRTTIIGIAAIARPAIITVGGTWLTMERRLSATLNVWVCVSCRTSQ